MIFRSCRRCGLPHPVEARWASRPSQCLRCWKLSKGYDLTKADQAMEAVHGYYTDKIKTIEARLDAVERSGSVDRARVDQLIKLCHPDRHRNTPASNDATAWLLRMRETLN